MYAPSPKVMRQKGENSTAFPLLFQADAPPHGVFVTDFTAEIIDFPLHALKKSVIMILN
jgi:hypothetical protein